MRALASHQCGPSSNPGVDAIWGLSLLLVLSLASRGFSSGYSGFPLSLKPTFPNSNSIWNAQTRFNEFIWTSKCSAGTNDNFSFKANIPSSHRSFCFSGLFRRVFLSSVLKRTRGREKEIISLSIFNNYSLKSTWVLSLVAAKQQGKYFLGPYSPTLKM